MFLLLILTGTSTDDSARIGKMPGVPARRSVFKGLEEVEDVSTGQHGGKFDECPSSDRSDSDGAVESRSRSST